MVEAVAVGGGGERHQEVVGVSKERSTGGVLSPPEPILDDRGLVAETDRFLLLTLFTAFYAEQIYSGANERQERRALLYTQVQEYYTTSGVCVCVFVCVLHTKLFISNHVHILEGTTNATTAVPIGRRFKQRWEQLKRLSACHNTGILEGRPILLSDVTSVRVPRWFLQWYTLKGLLGTAINSGLQPHA